MNSSNPGHPELTALALGELSAAEAARIRQWVAQSPEAEAELAFIEETVGVLHQMPAMPRRTLTARQRDTVLSMERPPAPQVRGTAPFLAFRRPARATSAGRQDGFRASGMLKFAAAAAVTLGAFFLGQKTSSRVTPAIVVAEDARPSSKPVETPAPVASPAPPAMVANAPTPAATVPPVATIVPPKAAPSATPVPETAVKVAQAPPAPVNVPKSTTAPAVSAPTLPPPPAVASVKPSPAAPPSLNGFTLAGSSAEAILDLQPKLVRPLPVPHEFAGVILSSPLPLNAKPATAPQRKPEAQPALVIHSWKAEIASCPWDSSRRLMRFVAQIPVEQAGIENFDQEYKLVAKFDPFHVQGFRLVTEKHMRPSSGGTQATRFAWYEIIPTRNFSAGPDKPVTIGTITVEQPRGSTPIDSSPLKLVDRGAVWSDAREDFIFETAMIGWSQLLQGAENTPGLNHKVVLDIAEKTKGEEPKGERAKFISIVRQAQRAVGL